MKVHLYGNILNNGYNLTRFLRARGVDATLFLNDDPTGQNMPWWEDRELTPSTLPPWIRYYPITASFLAPSKATVRMIHDFGQCDVALVCGFGPILAARARVPFVFYSYGSDLCIVDPVIELRAYLASSPRARDVPRHVAWLLLYSSAQRLALSRADRILVLMGFQMRPYAEKFGLADRTTKARLAWDTAKYAAPLDEPLYDRYKQYDIVFFMIARHSWRSLWADLKGNDRFFRAFRRFVDAAHPRVRVVTIEKGPDVEASRRLIRELGIEEHVEWVREMDKDGVRAYESLPNCVVVDQFWHLEWYRKYPADRDRAISGFGSGAIEAMSAGRPVLTMFSDQDFYEGASPPILNAFTEQEIYLRLLEVNSMSPDQRRALGEAGRAFAYRWHDWHLNVDLYIDALAEVALRRGIRWEGVDAQPRAPRRRGEPPPRGVGGGS